MSNKMMAPDADDSPCELPYASHFTCVHSLASYVCSACVDIVFASSCNCWEEQFSHSLLLLVSL